MKKKEILLDYQLAKEDFFYHTGTFFITILSICMLAFGVTSMDEFGGVEELPSVDEEYEEYLYVPPDSRGLGLSLGTILAGVLLFFKAGERMTGGYYE